MRKDITKKFLMRENRFLNRMTSLSISNFVSKKSKSRLEKNKAFQLDYDLIEFANMLNVSKNGCLNTQNDVVVSGFKQENYILKNGKYTQFNMLFCGIGSFTMGHESITDNQPKFELILNPFLLGEVEITQELYELVMGKNPSWFNDRNTMFSQYRQLMNKSKMGDTSKHPIESVSWYDAIEFCNELSKLQGLQECYTITNPTTKNEDGLEQNRIMFAQVDWDINANGYRLPTDIEWEYAAKANTNNQFAGTDDDGDYLEEYAWFDKNSNDQTHPVAAKKPNEWGFYDMCGNVNEWCWDESTTRHIASKDANYHRSYLGGSWDYEICDLSIVHRHKNLLNLRKNIIGIRVCRSIIL